MKISVCSLQNNNFIFNFEFEQFVQNYEIDKKLIVR